MFVALLDRRRIADLLAHVATRQVVQGFAALAAQGSAQPVPPRASRAPATVGGVVQVGGQLGLVLTLDGVTLCVVPLGPRAEPVHDAMVA